MKIYESKKWCSFSSSFNSESQKWFEIFEEMKVFFFFRIVKIVHFHWFYIILQWFHCSSSCNLIKSCSVCFKNLLQCSMLNAFYIILCVRCIHSLCYFYTLSPSILSDPPQLTLLCGKFQFIYVFRNWIHIKRGQNRQTLLWHSGFTVCRCTHVQCTMFWVIFDGTLVVFFKLLHCKFHLMFPIRKSLSHITYRKYH